MAKAVKYFQDMMVADQSLAQLCTLPAHRPLTLEEILVAMDYIHISTGLLAPYNKKYPLVESRELIPSFDAPLVEYKGLPAFSVVVLDRMLKLQDEGFQFDVIWPEGSPPDPSQVAQNRQILRERLPRNLLKDFEQIVGRKAVSPFCRYAQLMPLVSIMDRGHVITKEPEANFCLTGIYASFPSDLDGEIKRLGKKIGKFSAGDHKSYALNRRFVYTFLMEQLGFPICGERHTSAALFALRLKRRKERFFIKVLGTSDRTITTYTGLGSHTTLPTVEKVALVAAQNRKDLDSRLNEQGFYIDPARKVVILKVSYVQHAYHADNILENRALSVHRQEVIHPLTGQHVEMDILGLSQDRMLMLNDIVRGEYQGAIVYGGRDRIEGTSDFKKRLMFLAAWLKKHNPLLAEYSAENFDRVIRILTSFLEEESLQSSFAEHQELTDRIKWAIQDLKIDHGLRSLEKLMQAPRNSDSRLKPAQVLTSLIYVLNNYGDQLRSRQPRTLSQLLAICRKQLKSPTLKRSQSSNGRKPTVLQNALKEEAVRLEQLITRYEQPFVEMPPNDECVL